MHSRSTEKRGGPLDLFGDSLPAGAVARLGTTRFRHPGEIASVAFSPDGKVIASASDEAVCYWDAASGRRIRCFRQDGYRFQAVAFSIDGNVLAVGRGGLGAPILLWNAQTGKEIRRLKEAHTSGGVICLGFTPDDKMLISSGFDGRLRFWDPATGQSLGEVQTGTTNLRGRFSVSKDGRLLACGDREGEIRIWDLKTKKEECVLRGHVDYVPSVALSGDGKTLASASNDGSFRLWDVATAKARFVIKAEKRAWNVAFSKDGQTLVAMEPGVIRFVNSADGKVTKRVTACAAWPPLAVFSPDGSTLATTSDHAIHLWDSSGKPHFPLDAHDGMVNALAFSPDGKTLATGAGDALIRFWDPATARVQRQLVGHPHAVNAIAFSRDGLTLVSTGRLDADRIWDAVTGKQLSTNGNNWSNAVAVTPDGKTLVTGIGPLVSFYDMKTNMRKYFGRHKGATFMGPLGEQRYETSHAGDVLAVACSRDGKTTASAGADKIVRLWETATGWQLAELSGHSETVNALAFSPDGELLASGSTDKTICLWHLRSRQPMATFKGHSRGVYGVTFSPDGHYFASGSSDGTVRLWETFTGQECCRFVGHQEWVGAVAFSPNGKVLASASGDGTVLIWNVWHGPAQNERKTPPRGDMAASWRDLASEETFVAYQAMSQLISQPNETVLLLEKRLPRASKPTSADISRWIARLEQGSYTDREKATEELKKLGALVEAALLEVLAGKPSLELRRRAESLLARPSPLDKDPEQLRARRAVVVLEYLGTREALQVLQSLSDGAVAARLTYDARAAVDRIGKQQRKP